MVSAEEFSTVIHSMAAGYAGEDSDEVVLASLKREPKRDKDDRNRLEEQDRPGFPDDERRRRQRF